jgi:hypothetical protein
MGMGAGGNRFFKEEDVFVKAGYHVCSGQSDLFAESRCSIDTIWDVCVCVLLAILTRLYAAAISSMQTLWWKQASKSHGRAMFMHGVLTCKDRFQQKSTFSRLCHIKNF